MQCVLVRLKGADNHPVDWEESNNDNHDDCEIKRGILDRLSQIEFFASCPQVGGYVRHFRHSLAPDGLAA